VWEEIFMPMTKAELVSIISEKSFFSRHESVRLVGQVFLILKETLEKGEKVKISGFGNFIVREKRPRKGRNPQTGEEAILRGRRVLTFKPSACLRKAMNQGPPSLRQFGAMEERSNEIKNF
jgi:integration host factor subunit alpha